MFDDASEFDDASDATDIAQFMIDHHKAFTIYRAVAIALFAAFVGWQSRRWMVGVTCAA